MGLGLEVKEKDKPSLIKEILENTKTEKKTNYIIALASNGDKKSSVIINAIRNEIDRQNQMKVFDLPTMSGGTYQSKLKFIPATTNHIKLVKEKKLTYRNDENINNLLEQANNFKTYFVIKPKGKDSWLMLMFESK